MKMPLMLCSAVCLAGCSARPVAPSDSESAREPAAGPPGRALQLSDEETAALRLKLPDLALPASCEEVLVQLGLEGAALEFQSSTGGWERLDRASLNEGCHLVLHLTSVPAPPGYDESIRASAEAKAELAKAAAAEGLHFDESEEDLLIAWGRDRASRWLVTKVEVEDRPGEAGAP